MMYGVLNNFHTFIKYYFLSFSVCIEFLYFMLSDSNNTNCTHNYLNFCRHFILVVNDFFVATNLLCFCLTTCSLEHSFLSYAYSISDVLAFLIVFSLFIYILIYSSFVHVFYLCRWKFNARLNFPFCKIFLRQKCIYELKVVGE